MNRIFQWLMVGMFLSGSIAAAQSVTVKEYYSATLDAYFLTGRTNEQTLLDTVPDFKATGMSFQAFAAPANTTGTEALSSICRFHITVADPYTSSHFYGVYSDCSYLLTLKNPNFNWEGYDFAIRTAVGGVCPTGTTAIYRGFRKAVNGKTSNHRYTTAANYVAASDAGWTTEGPSFCASSATDAAVIVPPVGGPLVECGRVYFPGKQFAYITTSPAKTDQLFRAYNGGTNGIEGQIAAQIVDSRNDGSSLTTMIAVGASSWTFLGTVAVTLGDVFGDKQNSLPPISFPYGMFVGQSVDVSRQMGSAPPFDFYNTHRRGKMTFVGKENVTVPAGTFEACKLRWDEALASLNSVITGQTLREIKTIWVVPNVGVVKERLQQGYVATPEPNMYTTLTEATSIR